jgi:outer membrane receptor protein involved in Fe transport
MNQAIIPITSSKGFARSLLLTCLFLFCGWFFLQAQSIIRGKVVDSTGKPVTNANVLLVNAKDSVLVKGRLTDQQGSYIFENIKAGIYLITATKTGNKPAYSKPFDVTDNGRNIDMGAIELERTDIVLAAVTVTAKKPLYEQKIDRLVINVAAAITYASISALDVLERSPGVMVSRMTRSISVNGKNGVIIMINGKRNYMDMAAVIEMLAGMPSGSVERIEIITTPPANFDAEGTAGIINIVLKSNDQFGTNGSYTLTAGYSKGEQTSGSINMNHRKGKINVFGNYSFSRVRLQQLWNNYHAVMNCPTFLENDSHDHRHALQSQHNIQTGMDYETSKKTIIGVLLSGNYRKWTMTSLNDASVSTDNKLDTAINTVNDELHTTLYLGANLNFQHTFKPDEKIVLNADYLYYKDKNPSQYLNSYADPLGTFLYDENVRSNKFTPLKFLIVAGDYSKKLSKKADMEAGLKATASNMTNDITVEWLSQNVWVIDTSLSGSHSQREFIGAGYTSFALKFSEKTSIKAGLRYEHTHTIIGTLTNKNLVERDYGNLFPSFFFQQTINENNSVNFSYSRRIYRPSFNDLAPWVLFLDPKTFQTGNPTLRPSIVDAINASYTFKNKIASFSYSRYAPGFFQYPTIDQSSNRLITAPQNSKYGQWMYVNLSLPFTVTKWWNMQNNMSYGWQQSNVFYKAPVRTESSNYYIYTVQNFLLPKDLSISLSGYYGSGGAWGLYHFKPWGGMDAGIQKKFTKKRASLTFNVSNIFNSSKSIAVADIPEQNLLMKQKNIYGYSGFSLSFTKNFGNDKLKGKRDRTTAAEDEKGRAY